MKFNIIDCNNGSVLCTIETNNGKNALRRFRNNYCLSSGFYEIHKNKRAGQWILSSTYGTYFVARKVKEA